MTKVTHEHYRDIVDSVAEQMNQYNTIFVTLSEYFEKNDYTEDTAVSLMKSFRDNKNQVGYTVANLIYMLSDEQRHHLAVDVKSQLNNIFKDNEVSINGEKYIITFLEVDFTKKNMIAKHKVERIVLDEAGEKNLIKEKDLDVDYTLLRNYPKSSKMAQHALRARLEDNFDLDAYVATQPLLPEVGNTRK